MAGTVTTNGGISVTTLAAIAVPSVGGLLLFINLSIAPLSGRLDRIEQDQRDMRTQIVPRGEHLEKWNSQAATDEEFRREIKAINDKIGDTWTMRDEMLRVQQQLDCLQSGMCKGTQPVPQR